METQPANPYAAARHDALDRFATRIEGPADCLFACAFARPLSAAASDALDKTAAALGYAQGATFVNLGQRDGALFSDNDAFGLLEGIDPRCLVVADAEASRLLEDAWREPVPPEAHCRVFGRETRAFADLNALMETPAGKQRAWALLKTLPKLSG